MTKPKACTPTVRTCSSCGHVGRYGSVGQADYHFPRHSCELVTMRRERTARHQAKLTTAGPARPCTCKRADHQHGDRSRYTMDGCRCLPCRVAARTYNAQRLRDVAYGRARQVDGAAARDHVRSLMGQGMGLRRIAATAGVAQSVIAKLLYGVSPDRPGQARRTDKKLEVGVAAKILAVRLDLAPGARVPVVGTTRRLQALVTIGWSQAKLADLLHAPPSHLTGLVHGRRDPNLSTAQAVRALYDQLWNQQPPTDLAHDRAARSRALSYADTHGWAPPLAWDDDTIDDPQAQPAHQLQPVDADGNPLRRGAGGQSAVDPVEVEFLTDQNLNRSEIARQLGVTVETLHVSLDRKGRTDLWDRLTKRELARPTDQRAAA